MRTSRRLAVPLLLAVAPSLASAFEWGGFAGLMYDRTDTWSATGVHFVNPSLNLDLSLNAAGSVVAPGIFDWSAGGAYRRVSHSQNGEQLDLSSGLTYRFSGALFQNRTSPLTLLFLASRTDTQFDTFGSSASSGDRTTDNLGATLRLSPTILPKVEISYTRMAVEDRPADLAPHRFNSDQLAAGFSQSEGTFNFGANYVGTWSDGDWVYDRTTTFAVNADARARVSDVAALFVSDAYYHRDPSEWIAGAFAQDLNGFQAGYRSGVVPGEKLLVRYVSRRGLAASATEESETVSNALDYFQDFSVNTEGDYLKVAGNLTNQTSRSALADFTANGATVGAEYSWRRAARQGRTWEVAAGPRLAYLDVAGSGGEVGYGATARGVASMPWKGFALSGNYAIGWGHDVSGQPGWSLDQSVYATINGQAGAGFLSAIASASARRASSPIGEEATRALSVSANYRWLKRAVFASLSYSTGILPGTPRDFVGDGFFLPIGADSRTTTASLGATANLHWNLAVRAEARHETSSIPGQPDLEGAQLIGALSYRLGAFELSIEDRMGGPGFNPADANANLFMLRATRTVGSRN